MNGVPFLLGDDYPVIEGKPLQIKQIFHCVQDSQQITDNRQPDMVPHTKLPTTSNFANT